MSIWNQEAAEVEGVWKWLCFIDRGNEKLEAHRRPVIHITLFVRQCMSHGVLIPHVVDRSCLVQNVPPILTQTFGTPRVDM